MTLRLGISGYGHLPFDLDNLAHCPDRWNRTAAEASDRLIRFPSHELAMMMTIALRFIPTLLEETDKIMKAQMARGADFESGNLIQRAKSLVPFAGSPLYQCLSQGR
jgi:hypothetical protein